MRRVRVCIYGGTDLQETPVDFISALAYKILKTMPAVIVTGGFLHSHAKPEAISTDVAALRGPSATPKSPGMILGIASRRGSRSLAWTVVPTSKAQSGCPKRTASLCVW